MKRELVYAIESYERRYRDEASIARRKIGASPHVSEKNFVGVFCESWGNISEGVACGCRFIRHET